MKRVLLVLIVLFSINVVSAGTYENGTLDMVISGTLGPEALVVGVTGRDIDTGWKLQVEDTAQIGTPFYFEFENVEFDFTGVWADIPASVGGPFNIGSGGAYGTGAFYILKSATQGRADVYMFFDENFGGVNGQTYDISIYDDIIDNYYTKMHSSSSDATRVQWHKDEFGMAFTYDLTNPIGYDDGTTGNAYLHNYGDFRNDYSIYTQYSYGEATITRSGFDVGLTSSSFIIKNSTGTELYNSGFSTSNATYYFANQSAYYYLEVEADSTEYLIYSTVPATPDFESVGDIELNQSSYTTPESVQINASLSSYDFDNYYYRILMYYSEDGGTSWDRLSISLNDSTMMDEAVEYRTCNPSLSYYDLPIKIKAVIEEYEKATGITTALATSSAVYYNPSAMWDYTLSGTVFDAATYSPIEGATITATGTMTTSDTSTVTGRFKLYLADGTYTINCSKSGYVSNVNEDIVIVTNISLYNIYLTQTSVTNGTINGIIKDADTDDALEDVHLIFTNASNSSDRIDAYSSSGGYYTGAGFGQSETYNIRAIKSGYYSYNGSVTIEATGGTHKSFDMVQINYTATATPTPIDTYPGGEGHAWTNDEIITMLRVMVPGVFMLLFLFLLIAVMTGFSGGNGGMSTLWRRY